MCSADVGGLELTLLVALRQTPSAPDVLAWGNQAEKLGVVGILAVVLVFFVIAMFKQWLVMGWMYRIEREEKIMWRNAYMDLRGTTRDVATVARIATEKAIQQP